MTDDDNIARVNRSLLDLTRVFLRRRFRLTLMAVSLGTMLTVNNFAFAQTIVQWPNCPPGPQVNGYFDSSQGGTAHFQISPVASPFGGNCSVDVVSGIAEVDGSGSAGGISFYTPEAVGGTYTIAFDMQWVSGQDSWQFINETAGNGDTNGLMFPVPYPGNRCWHHYEYTGATGPAGPKHVGYFYQQNAGPQEMRIANLTMSQAWRRHRQRPCR